MLENQSDDLFPVRVLQEVDRVERIEARVHAPRRSERRPSFAVYTAIEFMPNAGGARAKHEEVGFYSAKNDIVTREEFFYEGRFIRRPPTIVLSPFAAFSLLARTGRKGGAGAARMTGTRFESPQSALVEAG